MSAISQRRALGVLFLVLTALFAGIGLAAFDAGVWPVGVAAAALAIWTASTAARSLRRG